MVGHVAHTTPARLLTKCSCGAGTSRIAAPGLVASATCWRGAANPDSIFRIAAARGSTHDQDDAPHPAPGCRRNHGCRRAADPRQRPGRGAQVRHPDAADGGGRRGRPAHAQGHAGGDRGGQQGGRRPGPQDRDGRRGRPDQPRGRRARGAQADRGRQGAGHHGHLGLGGDERRGAGVLGVEDVPVHGLGRGLHHPAAAPGLSHPHAAELQAAGHLARRVHRRHGQEEGGRDRHPGALRAVDQGAPRQRAQDQGRQRRGAHHLREGQADLPLRDRPGDEGRPGFPLSQRLRAGHGGGAARSVQGQHQPAQVRPVVCRAAEDAGYDPRRGVGEALHRPAVGRYRRPGVQARQPAARASNPTPTRRRPPTGRAW